MIINRIDVYKLTIPSRPYRIALGWIDSAPNLLVRVHTAGGWVGLGEAAPIGTITGETQTAGYAAAQEMARVLLGKEATAIEARLHEMDAMLIRNATVKSAFDMALYDLLAKRAGLPLCVLLGGQRRPIVTDMTIGIDTPATMAEEAQAALSRGFGEIKVKLGTGRAADVARMRAIRAAVGPAVSLRIDANQGWSAPTAIATLNDMANLDIDYCEQPVAAWDLAALRYVRQGSPIPIMADESLFDHHDAFKLASLKACDYFNIKLAKSGGIHNALKIDAIAEAAGIRCMAGSMAETRLGISAAAHLVAARPNIAYANLDTHFFHIEDPILGGVTSHGAVLTLPDLPGHGADILPDVLAHLEGVSITA